MIKSVSESRLWCARASNTGKASVFHEHAKLLLSMFALDFISAPHFLTPLQSIRFVFLALSLVTAPHSNASVQGKTSQRKQRRVKTLLVNNRFHRFTIQHSNEIIPNAASLEFSFAEAIER